MKIWKYGIVAAIGALAFVSLSCASNPKVSGLLSLDEAIEGAVVAIEGRVSGGSEIAVYKITAPHDSIGDYLAEDLNDKISMRGNLVPLARGAALENVDTEHQFQMSGLVRDDSAVGIGHYLGAKVVITGTFNRYADFSQFRLRAINVETSALLYSYTSRINNRDPVLANITASLGTIQASRTTETALANFNRGNDLSAEGKFDEAIAEFDKALAINRDFAEAYLGRGIGYYFKRNFDKSITDFTQAIRLNPNFAQAYFNRGAAYIEKDDFDRAIADFNAALRINPDYSDAQLGLAVVNDLIIAAVDYTGSGIGYLNNRDFDRAIADFTQAIRLNPNYASAYRGRSMAYYLKGDFDRAIADLEVALRIEPNNADARTGLIVNRKQRGTTYYNNKDYERAITDFNAVLRIEPNDKDALKYRGYSYYYQRDYNRAIADFEAVLRIDPNDANARQWLDSARQARGR